MCLDEPFLFIKRRAHPDIDHTIIDGGIAERVTSFTVLLILHMHAYSVHPIGRQELVWIEAQVGRGEADKPPPLISANDLAAYQDRMPQQCICLRDLPLGHQRTDARAADARLTCL